MERFEIWPKNVTREQTVGWHSVMTSEQHLLSHISNDVFLTIFQNHSTELAQQIVDFFPTMAISPNGRDTFHEDRNNKNLTPMFHFITHRVINEQIYVYL